MRYHSRAYIRSKYERIKHDIEKYLDIYNEDEDSINDEQAKKVIWNLEDCFDSILKELKK